MFQINGMQIETENKHNFILKSKLTIQTKLIK